MKSSRGKDPINGVAKTPKKVPGKLAKDRQKDPVEVYCRVRPLKEDEAASCVDVNSDTAVQLRPPECSLAFKAGHTNPTLHTFKHVFGPDVNQSVVFERIGVPLVEGLLSGKNGLLFAYGITNSGKTYTMTGDPEAAGVLPRSLDVVFNSISEVQAPRYVFRPDGTNGYNIFSEEEANLEQKRSKPKKWSPRMRAEQPDLGDLLRVPEPKKLDRVVDEDSGYAVFVSYVEIYNNYVYDLLEEVPNNPIKQKPPSSHILREDSSRNMYVSGAVEVEVKSTEEAFEVLCRGQKKRRVAHTQLHEASSRSHSVFTIRLVQAPLDHTGKEVLQDKDKVVVSQLSLVDLAGSERTSRTKTKGDRLKEASNINKALLVLRNCMETLRDNQTQGTSTIVPYRDTKLTHLFKNYFDGEGKVRMIVCVSPKQEDYDESIHVMKFAEVTQEVVVDRPQSKKVDTGLAPGRKRAYLLYRAAMKEANAHEEDGKEMGTGEAAPFSTVSPPHPYMLALGVLAIQKYLSEECSIENLKEFKEALEQRDKVRGQLIQDLKKKQLQFRENLVKAETETEGLRRTVVDLKHQIKVKDKSSSDNKKLRDIVAAQDEKMVQLTAELERSTDRRLKLERELIQTKHNLEIVSEQKNVLAKTKEKFEADKRELEEELSAERYAVRQREEEKEMIRTKMQGFVSAEKEKIDKLSNRIKNKEKDLAIKNAKLRQVEDIIKNSPCPANANSRVPLRDANGMISPDEMTSATASLAPSIAPSAATTTIVSNEEDGTPGVPAPANARGPHVLGRKRIFSENWLVHKPATNVACGDILQPVMKKKKTVTNPKPKHLRSNIANKYCLEHQEEGSEGDVKTDLFKGDIMETRGGGRSVQFTDVEVLRHSHSILPKKSPRQNLHQPLTQSRNTRSRQSNRLVGKAQPYSSSQRSESKSRSHNNPPEGAVALSHSPSLSSISSTESSIEEQDWTDVETRCAVALEGMPGCNQPALVHMSPKYICES